MPSRLSAGLLVFRRGPEGIEVFLVHPGGPFWAKKDEHAWSIPKGETEQGEDLLGAACREFTEETGFPPPAGPIIELGSVAQSRKQVHAWAVEATDDLDPTDLVSNTFELEWPPRSGSTIEVPEVDRAGWFDLVTAPTKLHKGQAPLIDRLQAALATDGDIPGKGTGAAS